MGQRKIATLVGVVMGSDSDWDIMRHAAAQLDAFGVAYEARVLSAHRMPDDMLEYAEDAGPRGLRCIIAGAGGAAHLPGMLASKTAVPVLGVPVPPNTCAARIRSIRSCRCRRVFRSRRSPSARRAPRTPGSSRSRSRRNRPCRREEARRVPPEADAYRAARDAGAAGGVTDARRGYGGGSPRAARRSRTSAPRPLAGLRVLDLTRLLPGPVCTLYLADLGADVVKIEDTGAGDYARNLGTRAGTVSAFFRAVNRNKRSLAIDLKDARGRDAFLALAKRADVIVESFRPGVVAVARRRLRRGRGDQPAHRLRVDHRLRPERSARAPRRTRHQLPGLRRSARPDRRARRPARAVQPADRRPAGRRGVGGRSRCSRRSSARSAPGAGVTSMSR